MQRQEPRKQRKTQECRKKQPSRAVLPKQLLTGNGEVGAGTGAFAISVWFPSVAGEPPGTTTPEELLAASYAAWYGIGLRSLFGRGGGRAQRITVDAVITATKGPDGIRIQSSTRWGG